MSATEIAEMRRRARGQWDLSWQLLRIQEGQWTRDSEDALEQCRQSMQVAVLLMEQMLSKEGRETDGLVPMELRDQFVSDLKQLMALYGVRLEAQPQDRDGATFPWHEAFFTGNGFVVD